MQDIWISKKNYFRHDPAEVYKQHGLRHIKNASSIPGILKTMQPQILVGFNMNIRFHKPQIVRLEREYSLPRIWKKINAAELLGRI